MEFLFTLLGGLGLFLYGMDLMSSGLQRLAGNNLKGFLRTVTKNRFLGVISGTLATAVVQSSSVTTVMMVGFVNAGLMALPQAISVTLGAHIGTTITGQIIAFRIQNFALPIIAAGSLLHLFGRSDRTKDFGNAIFGFGILFFGLNLMGIAFDPLQENSTFQNLFQTFAKNPFLGLVAGLCVTILVQSSSVTTGITIALALANAITFAEAVPLILGENIGTTVTANIAAMGGSRTAKQAARAHFIVNAIGAIVALILLKPFMNLVLAVSPQTDVARQIANSHTLFNVLTTLLFIPFIKQTARFTEFLVGAKKEREELYYLEKTSLQDPGTALDQVKIALMETETHARDFMKLLGESVLTMREKNMGIMRRLSEKILRYQSRITEFLERITSHSLSHRESRKIPRYVRILHEIERIRDYEEKIMDVLIHLQSEGRKLRPIENRELKEFFEDVLDLLLKTNGVIGTEEKKLALQVMGVYETLAAKKDELRDRARVRFQTRRTSIATANYYFDIITALEEVAKKCKNIGAAVVE